MQKQTGTGSQRSPIGNPTMAPRIPACFSSSYILAAVISLDC